MIEKKDIKFEFVVADEPTEIQNHQFEKNWSKFDTNKYHEKTFTWELFKFAGKVSEEESSCEYIPIPSSQNLNSEVFAEDILRILNSESEINTYEVDENDRLEIKVHYRFAEFRNRLRPFIGDYLSFIYQNEWTINSGFDHVGKTYKLLENGVLLINKN